MQVAGNGDTDPEVLVADIDDDEDETGAEEPIDLTTIDPEAWYPGIPNRPPPSLVGWIVAMPLAAASLRELVHDRVAREDPAQLSLLDAWGPLIVASLVGGIVLAMLVPIVTRLVRGRDRLIVGLLERGFRVGVVLVVALIGLQTVLAASLVIALEYLILGDAFPGSAGFVLFAGLVSVTSFAIPALDKLRSPTAWIPAVIADGRDAPELIRRVTSLAERIGVEAPSAILIGPTMEWWTANGAVQTFDGAVSGGLLHVSLPQLALLSEPEVDGILAHELAHRREGSLEMADRTERAFRRVGTALASLKSESRGAARYTAAPGIAWLEFAADAVGAAVGERYRSAEASADAIAAEVVGSRPIASGLLVGEAVQALEDDWSTTFRRSIEGGSQDPLRAFAVKARRTLRTVDAGALILESLWWSGPTHPPLLSRLRAIGHEDIEFELTASPACRKLLTDPRATTRRLVDRLRSVDERGDQLELNAPRLTAGAIGWLFIGLVFALLLTRSWVASGPTGDLPILTVFIAGLWLLFPVVYPWLQREAIVDQRGIRVRPWWWRWLDPDAERLRWSEVRWTDSLRVNVGFDTIVTATDGTSTIRFWADLWSSADRDRLYDAVRERGSRLTFRFLAGDRDQARQAVVYYVDGRLLVPNLRRLPTSQVVEVKPVKVVGVGGLDLSFVLIDRLEEAIADARSKDVVVDVDDLATLVDLDLADFQQVARRVVVEGRVDEWTIRVDGSDAAWTAPRDAVRAADLDEAVYAILDLDPTANRQVSSAGIVVSDGDPHGPRSAD